MTEAIEATRNTPDAALIGAAVIGMSGTIGYIVAAHEKPAGSYSLGTGRMEAIRRELEIVFPASGHISRTPDTIAAPWLAEARRANIPPADDLPSMVAAAKASQQATWDRAQAEAAARKEREAAFSAECSARIPSWAAAAILAEYEQDDCDSMSDYFNTVTKRRVIIGFSRHTRDLFPELRAAAATFPETASLATAPDNAEHREKYSMGAGYYLKASSRYASGWAIRKRSLYGDSPSRGLAVAEWHLSEAAPKAAAPAAATPGGMTIEAHMHTKKGFEMHICILPDRVERETFDALRDKAQALGGWYSRAWGRTPGGFAFRDRATAEAFAGLDVAAPEGDGGQVQAEPVASAKAPMIAEKLRDMAAKVQADIDHCYRDRLTNTPKRMREAQGARLDGMRWERTQKALRALAAAHDAGTVPPVLARIASKSAVWELVRTEIDRSRGGYYDAGTDTGKPSLSTPEAVAIWAMIDGQSEEARKVEEFRKAQEALQFANIPGFFPTPAPIVAMMLDRADIGPGMSVLEPSAGSGNILDAIRAACPEADLIAYEIAPRLADILKRKGYQIEGADFMEAPLEPPVDRVVMNPPFENGQDAAHVMRAYDMLKPGGRLVAIMSPGPFFRSNRKSQEFRDWFDSVGGERCDLPEGSFKASGTGVATVLVEVRK